MEFNKITESDSNHNNLELKTTKDLVNIINSEDMTVANSVKKILPKLTELIDKSKQLQLLLQSPFLNQYIE